jgi:predicted alpha/beta hydrolase family esterase
METNEANCIILHGCPADSSEEKTKEYARHWMPWIMKELTKRGITTEIPYMPEPWQPNYETFKIEFEKYSVTPNTILIGHSCGCAFLVRWLGETKRRIKKLILIAPWKINNRNDKWRKRFYEFPIDETIKERVKEIIMFTADNEVEDGKKSLSIFHKALGGKIIELKRMGHYCLEDMGTEKFPELLEEIINDI